ncbi:MAG: ferritin-like domain-containing protein [Actinomycetota bacterium]|nr:ferritin-like domain-containing protein [Actinomycetota bacterium]
MDCSDGEGQRLTETSRRSFACGVGFGGLTLAIGGTMIPLASLWSPAYALATMDKSLVAFVGSVELAVVNAYGEAAKTGKVTGDALTIAKTFAAHHLSHASALGRSAGDTGKGQPNPKLTQSVTTMIDSAPDQTAILKIVYGLENAAASTYLFVIGALSDPNALKATASILPVESQHAVVIGNMLGMSPGADTGTYIPAFLSTDAAVQPGQYPMATGS